MDQGEARLEPGFTFLSSPLPGKSQGSAGQGLKPQRANIPADPSVCSRERDLLDNLFTFELYFACLTHGVCFL